ncbi:MAG: DNA-binding response regulator, partial [Proteobacteria bacterium]|nr:DNA-binding response regulator [Pseudomonadota bacterium]
DLAAYEVLVRGVPVALTYREYELLKFLATHPNRVFNRNTLLQKVWRYEAFVGTRTVDIHIRRLRSKLGDVGSGIQTVRNVGYKFNLESRV